MNAAEGLYTTVVVLRDHGYSKTLLGIKKVNTVFMIILRLFAFFTLDLSLVYSAVFQDYMMCNTTDCMKKHYKKPTIQNQTMLLFSGILFCNF